MIPKELEPLRAAPDFAAIAKQSYSMLEEARALRRLAAEHRVELRFLRANASITHMSKRDRERAIDQEAYHDRTCRLIVRADGTIAIGQVRLIQTASRIIASAGIDAADPSGLASELLRSYERGQDLLNAPKTYVQHQREMRLNRNASLTTELF